MTETNTNWKLDQLHQKDIALFIFPAADRRRSLDLLESLLSED